MTKTKASGSTVEDSGVSLSQVKDLFKQTNIVLQAVVTTIRKNSFKCFVQILVESTNKKMADLTRAVQDLKNSLQFSQGQLDEFKQENGKMTAICKSLREDISSVCETMITMMEKSYSLEGQSRRNNMVEDGISESTQDLDGV